MEVDNKLKKIIVKAIATYVLNNSEVTNSIWTKISSEISEEFYSISPLRVKELFYKEVLPSLETCNYGFDDEIISALRHLKISLALPSKENDNDHMLSACSLSASVATSDNSIFFVGLQEKLYETIEEVEWNGQSASLIKQNIMNMSNDPLNVSIEGTLSSCLGEYREFEEGCTDKRDHDYSNLNKALVSKVKIADIDSLTAVLIANDPDDTSNVKMTSTQNNSIFNLPAESPVFTRSQQFSEAEQFKLNFKVCVADSSDDEEVEIAAQTKESDNFEGEEADSTTITPEPFEIEKPQDSDTKQVDTPTVSNWQGVVFADTDDENEEESVEATFRQEIIPFDEALEQCKVAYQVKQSSNKV